MRQTFGCCARGERPRCRSAEKRDELAPFQLIEWHRCSLAGTAAYRIGEHQVRGLLQLPERNEIQRSSWRLCLRPHDAAALKALGRPDCRKVVEFGNGLRAGRQRHPGLLRRRKDVDVRRTPIRIIKCPDADEPDGGSSLRVVAPDGDFAGRTPGYLLTPATGRGRHNDLWLTRDMRDTISLIKCV